MSLSEKEFVEKVFAIENKLEILKIAVLDGVLITLMCLVVSIVDASFGNLAISFGAASLIVVGIMMNVGYFPVMNFRRKYMPSYSEDELDFIERCEPMNPFAASNFVKYQHLFVE